LARAPRATGAAGERTGTRGDCWGYGVRETKSCDDPARSRGRRDTRCCDRQRLLAADDRHYWYDPHQGGPVSGRQPRNAPTNVVVEERAARMSSRARGCRYTLLGSDRGGIWTRRGRAGVLGRHHASASGRRERWNSPDDQSLQLAGTSRDAGIRRQHLGAPLVAAASVRAAALRHPSRYLTVVDRPDASGIQIVRTRPLVM